MTTNPENITRKTYVKPSWQVISMDMDERTMAGVVATTTSSPGGDGTVPGSGGNPEAKGNSHHFDAFDIDDDFDYDE